MFLHACVLLHVQCAGPQVTTQDGTQRELSSSWAKVASVAASGLSLLRKSRLVCLCALIIMQQRLVPYMCVCSVLRVT